MELLTDELAANTREHEKHLSAEAERYAAEMEKMRAEHKSQLDRVTDKHNRHLKEVSALQTALSQLRTQHSNQLAETEQR